jgi:lipopolysaccharide transport system ATP-binding protein
MSRPIIEVHGIAKRYQLGQIGMTSFREEMQRLFSRRPAVVDRRAFWALRDVTFNIEPGSIVGIIGHNGAGKSTLLKILSRITEPTLGEVHLRGRVASLLEVGTGFHPELSGRENIYLNGTILGMQRQEISRKFDEIVAFAEVEKFIDTPVKRYSTGMHVRLAFAVAAHLEPEILLIDEVLAVGDVNFQRKCLGKMQEVSHHEGRTILFVSHNMNAVERLCERCISLQDGRITADGTDVAAIVRINLQRGGQCSAWTNSGGEWGNEWFRPDLLTILGSGHHVAAIPNNTAVRIAIAGEVLREHHGMQIGIGLFNTSNDLLFYSTVRDTAEVQWPELKRGDIRLECEIPAHFLNEGSYRVELFLGLHHERWICEPGVSAPSVSFEIQGGLSDSPFWVERRPGTLGPLLDWTVTA